jgi:hypothetical protein
MYGDDCRDIMTRREKAKLTTRSSAAFSILQIYDCMGLSTAGVFNRLAACQIDNERNTNVSGTQVEIINTSK